MHCIGICVLFSTIISIITTKILAAYYFKIISSHVDDMCEMTNEFVRAIFEILHRSKQNSDLEE